MHYSKSIFVAKNRRKCDGNRRPAVPAFFPHVLYPSVENINFERMSK